MGNQNTKDTSKDLERDTAHVGQGELFSNTYKTVTKNGEREFTSGELESILFPSFLELSELIYMSLKSHQERETSKSLKDGELVPEETRTVSQPGNHLVVSSVETKVPSDQNITEKTFIDFANKLTQKEHFQECSDFYFNLFSSDKEGLNEKDCGDLVKSCCKAGLVLCGCSHTEAVENQSIKSAVQSLLSLAQDGVLKKDQFESWIHRNCHRLLDPLHTFVCQKLKSCDFQQPSAISQSEFFIDLTNNKYLLSVVAIYLLSCQLSPVYFPSNTSSHIDQLESRLHLPLSSVLQGGWQLLYNSNAQGLSINRFQHHVFQYKGPTVTLLAFEGYVYCLCINEEWREGSKFWGGTECCLLQLEPHFKVMQRGSDLVFLNWSQRSLPKGIQIGNQGRSRVLEIDGEFTRVKHFGIELQLHRTEVWGCGGDSILSEQQKQRAWEKKDTQKHKDRKLKIDDWEDSPDRQLLEWGGVKTRHDERM